MSDAPASSSEYNEADRLEQSIDAEPPEMDDQDVEASAHTPDRSEASSLEANPADLEEQDREVALDEPAEGSTLEEI
ncbi:MULTISPECIES: hypothetical protein [unclassified Kocuria]|uniref:hypothetical protein n=1 Tax=Kocuria TaxID=57493 RepID=UPI00064ADBFE|nr:MULTISPECIES: hypothetical protein [unclassified Kocuria]KLU10321.1 hypothetical protein ABL57_07315 [Kocuria sp. SM24M-10]OLT06774.1 hypothetical protein BJF77_15465 [Kocuria sp. CNJ-770]